MVDQNVSGQFAAARDRLEICNPDGRLLGYFVPARNGYNGPECPLTEEELDRISRKGGGRPLADILADLDARS
jgi:hypothetical protein